MYVRLFFMEKHKILQKKLTIDLKYKTIWFIYINEMKSEVKYGS